MCAFVGFLFGGLIGTLFGGLIGTLVGFPVSLYSWLRYGTDFWLFFKYITLGFSFFGLVVSLYTPFGETIESQNKQKSKDTHKKNDWKFFERSISESLGNATENWLNAKNYVKSYRRKDGSYVKGHYRRKRK